MTSAFEFVCYGTRVEKLVHGNFLNRPRAKVSISTELSIWIWTDQLLQSYCHV